MIYIENKRKKIESIERQYPNAWILDLTSKSQYAQKLSPFYPFYDIPIPFSNGMTATCVEAVWQGLKVFETEDINITTFHNNTMKNIKRTVRKLGKPLGHRKGVKGSELLDYFDARMTIYLPTYKWMLDNKVSDLIERIKMESQKQDVVFLDYNTNIDFRDISSPLSHAGLVKLYIEGNYPDINEQYEPLTKYKLEARKNKSLKTNKNLDNKTIKVPLQLSLFETSE